MTFTPRFSSAKSIEPVLNNIVTLVQGNIEDALEWANGGPGLAIFAEYNNWDLTTITFPTFTLEPGSVDIKESEDGSSLDQVYNLIATIEIEGADPEQVTKDLLKYSLAVREIILSATPEDMFTGSGATDGFWTVTNELLSRAGVNVNNNFYGRAARLNIAVGYSEVAG